RLCVVDYRSATGSFAGSPSRGDDVTNERHSMTKALQYVEIDVPIWAPSIVELHFERTATADTNTSGYSHTWTASGTATFDVDGGALGLGDLDLNTPSSPTATDVIFTPDAAEYDFADDDWTIEFYFWSNTAIDNLTAHDMFGQRLGNGGAAT